MTDQDSAQNPGESERWQLSWRLLQTLWWTSLTVYSAVWLAWSVGGWIILNGVTEVLGIPLAAGVGGLGISFFATSAQQIMACLKRPWTYVVQGSARAELYPAYLALGSTVSFVILVATLSKALPPPQEPEAPTLPSMVVYLTPEPEEVEGDEPLASFPILFQDPASGPPKWEKGVHPEGYQAKEIRRLIESLNACVGTSQSQDVVIRIRGFADSNEFANVSAEVSAELNRQAANLRARNVAEIVEPLRRKEGGAALVVEEVVSWETFEEMKKRKPWVDLPLTQTDGWDQGLFNRRAEILLLSAGVCERPQNQGRLDRDLASVPANRAAGRIDRENELAG